MSVRAKSTKVCAREDCGKVFHPFRASQRFCSRTCGNAPEVQRNGAKRFNTDGLQALMDRLGWSGKVGTA